MLNVKTGVTTAACLAASVLFGATASAEIIFDNSTENLGQRTDSGNAEVGDVVNFAGTDRILTDFKFEYFMTPGGSGNETGHAFIYALDGPGGLPGTVLYDSGNFTLEGGFHTVNATGLSLVVPDSVAWTVLFNGLEGTEDAGLLFYSPPTVGTSPNFTTGVSYTLLRETGGGWQLVDHPQVADNLGAQFVAVPEPTTWALLLGGLATFGLIRRRKSS